MAHARTQDVDPDRPRLIKRYANRKLYDTFESRYVTLQQIADFVREGQDVQIIDNTTKEDLTNVTLAQIIYEEEKKGEPSGRRSRGLREFVQQGRHRLMSSLRDGPVGKLVTRHEGDAEEPAAGFEAEREPRRSPKEALEELRGLADDRVRNLVGVAMSHVQQLQSEVRRLQARIEELEARLVSMTRRRREESDESHED